MRVSPISAAKSGMKPKQRGFGLILTLFAMAVTVMTLGTAIDLSHIYLVKHELQTIADEIALSAARELDGSWEGLERAKRAVGGESAEKRQEWLSFSTDEVAELRMRFRSQPDAEWDEFPLTGAGQRFVEVTLASEARMFFLPMAPGMPGAQRVVARSVAGQALLAKSEIPALEFSAEATSPAAPEYGFEPGRSYALHTRSITGCADALASIGQRDTDRSTDEWIAAFLIRASQTGGGPCAVAFVGASPVLNARRNGAGPQGAYEVRLIQ